MRDLTETRNRPLPATIGTTTRRRRRPRTTPLLLLARAARRRGRAQGGPSCGALLPPTAQAPISPPNGLRRCPDAPLLALLSFRQARGNFLAVGASREVDHDRRHPWSASPRQARKQGVHPPVGLSRAAGAAAKPLTSTMGWAAPPVNRPVSARRPLFPASPPAASSPYVRSQRLGYGLAGYEHGGHRSHTHTHRHTLSCSLSLSPRLLTAEVWPYSGRPRPPVRGQRPPAPRSKPRRQGGRQSCRRCGRDCWRPARGLLGTRRPAR